MSKSLKSILIAIVGLFGLLILISVALFFYVDTSSYKPRLERSASEAFGMEVHVGGRLGISFFPGLHVGLDDVRIRNQEMDIASAEEAALRSHSSLCSAREVRIRRIGLQRPRIIIEKDRDGKFNFEKRKGAQGMLPALGLNNISLSDGIFIYGNEQSGKGFEVENINLDILSLRTTL
jgi:uncharacterized protein involved in outer membrane biogenesis